jgi:hypothetical protein
LATGEQCIDLSPHHQPDYAVDGSFPSTTAPDLPAVSEHRVTVAEFHHLDAVGDEDDAQPTRPEIADNAEELLS